MSDSNLVNLKTRINLPKIINKSVSKSNSSITIIPKTANTNINYAIPDNLTTSHQTKRPLIVKKN
jgi:hypothetical protein